MANRFGRNQRRKMRAQVQEVTLKNTELQGAINRTNEGLYQQNALLQKHGDKIRRLEKEISDARKVVGHYSVLFPPDTLEMNSKPQDRIRVHVPPIMDVNSLEYGENYEPTSASFDITELSIMLANVNFDPVKGGQHVIVTFGDGKWGYAMDSQAMKTMPTGYLVESIAKQLAMLIAQSLTNDRGSHAVQECKPQPIRRNYW